MKKVFGFIKRIIILILLVYIIFITLSVLMKFLDIDGSNYLPYIYFIMALVVFYFFLPIKSGAVLTDVLPSK